MCVLGVWRGQSGGGIGLIVGTRRRSRRRLGGVSRDRFPRRPGEPGGEPTRKLSAYQGRGEAVLVVEVMESLMTGQVRVRVNPSARLAYRVFIAIRCTMFVVLQTAR